MLGRIWPLIKMSDFLYFRNCPQKMTQSGVNIFHYSQIKYLGKVSIFWCFREEFLHFDEKFQLYLRILMKITNYLVDYMVYASLLGKSLFLAFGKGFLGFCKIFTPVLISIFLRIKSIWASSSKQQEQCKQCKGSNAPC